MRAAIVDTVIREVNPVTDADVEAWRRSPSAASLRTRAMTAVEPAFVDVTPIGAHRRNRVRSIALVSAIVLVPSRISPQL